MCECPRPWPWLRQRQMSHWRPASPLLHSLLKPLHKVARKTKNLNIFLGTSSHFPSLLQVLVWCHDVGALPRDAGLGPGRSGGRLGLSRGGLESEGHMLQVYVGGIVAWHRVTVCWGGRSHWAECRRKGGLAPGWAGWVTRHQQGHQEGGTATLGYVGGRVVWHQGHQGRAWPGMVECGQRSGRLGHA